MSDQRDVQAELHTTRNGKEVSFRCIVKGENIFLSIEAENTIFGRYRNPGGTKAVEIPLKVFRSQMFINGYKWSISIGQEILWDSEDIMNVITT